MIKIRLRKDAYSFSAKNTLHPDLWEENTLKSEIRKALQDIVDEFLEFLGIEVEIEDIQLTGSLANYNYTSYSDVDLHILIDFSKVDENIDLVAEFLKSKKNLWNNRHKITIKGFEVEIYPQDASETHHSTGIYSILDDEWIAVPDKSSFTA